VFKIVRLYEKKSIILNNLHQNLLLAREGNREPIFLKAFFFLVSLIKNRLHPATDFNIDTLPLVADLHYLYLSF
jgi:hypothetical protein